VWAEKWFEESLKINGIFLELGERIVIVGGQNI
jgi:hypothetical protein